MQRPDDRSKFLQRRRGCGRILREHQVCVGDMRCDQRCLTTCRANAPQLNTSTVNGTTPILRLIGICRRMPRRPRPRSDGLASRSAGGLRFLPQLVAHPGCGLGPEPKPVPTQTNALCSHHVSGRLASAGHAFLSYVREDSWKVDMLQRKLNAAGIPVWRDTSDLWPGEDWRVKIRRNHRRRMVFIACFSKSSTGRNKSYQYEELVLAVEQLRQRRPDDPWFIPVRLDDCKVPDHEIGAGRTLSSLQRIDLFGSQLDKSAERLVAAVKRILERPTSVEYEDTHRQRNYARLALNPLQIESALLAKTEHCGQRSVVYRRE